jgi:aquaporin Z
MTAKLLAEAIGTFFLVLAIGLAVNVDPTVAPLAIGLTLTVMVYANGHISGAHFNPAVTVAAWMRGALPAREVGPYWAAQCTGALMGCFLTYKFTGIPVHVAPGEGVSLIKAITGEAIMTFGLAYVILNVATSKATSGNSYYGLAIGGTVAAGAYIMGGISGGAFNPAVGIAPAIFSMLIGRDAVPQAWIYLLGPVLGAAAAAIAYKRVNPEG